MKNRIVLFVAGCIALFLSSCLNSDEQEYDIPKDCQITTFSLSSDSVAGLSAVKFVIDQVNGRIFNPDSMPYGTEIEKVICTISRASGVYSIEVTQDALPDSTFFWDTKDSLDFSKPVKFVTTAYDGITKKTYMAQVNIHQQVPDSMSWNLLSENLPGFPAKEQKVMTRGDENNESYYMYTQSAGADNGYSLHVAPVSNPNSWTELPLEGLPAGEARLSQMTEYENAWYVPTTKGALYRSADGQKWDLVEMALSVKTVLGAIADGGLNQSSSLSAIIDNNGTLNFGVMDKDMNWTTGGVVPDGFPVSGFGSLSVLSSASKQYSLTVVAGKDKNSKLLNSAWSTTNGYSWVLLTDIEADYFDKREGIMLSVYDDKYCMIGGINESNKALKDIYFSDDRGVTWALSDTLTVMPEDYKARGFASVAVNKDNFMLIFGGKESNSANELGQLWQGRINRLGFKD
ncbi:DUF6242 domain-containing protein [Parabacteroides sp.]